MADKNKYGALIIRSDPPGAMVTINDVIKTTPAIFDLKGRTPPYSIMIEKLGYDDYIQKVVVSNGAKIEINAVLTKTNE